MHAVHGHQGSTSGTVRSEAQSRRKQCHGHHVNSTSSWSKAHGVTAVVRTARHAAVLGFSAPRHGFRWFLGFLVLGTLALVLVPFGFLEKALWFLLSNARKTNARSGAPFSASRQCIRFFGVEAA